MLLNKKGLVKRPFCKPRFCLNHVKIPPGSLIQHPAFSICNLFSGVWLSLVERTVRDREAGGSNPPTPTRFDLFKPSPEKMSWKRSVYSGSFIFLPFSPMKIFLINDWFMSRRSSQPLAILRPLHKLPLGRYGFLDLLFRSYFYKPCFIGMP